MMTLCKRRSDGALFRPSFPDGYDEGQAIADTLLGKGPNWYFRGVAEEQRGRWFWRKSVYRDTGEVWEPSAGEEFDVIEVNARRRQ